jgi:uncharacterized phage protein gp47/JayE
VDLPSRLDLYGIGRNYVVQRATRIDPGQIDVDGTDVNIFVGSMAAVSSYLVQQLAMAFSKLLLDSANDTDLDRLVFDRYQMTRKGASAAVGAVRISRPTALAGAGAVPVGTNVVTLTGIVYVTTTVANFGASDLTSTANVRAVQAGKSTQVGANAIRKFSNPSSLFDGTLTVNNDLATAGGEPQEDDDTLRNRARDFWRTVRRGTLGAIEFGALAVPGVVSAQAIEAVEAIGGVGAPARVVVLYISDSSGVASQALGDAVSASLLDYRAAGIFVLVVTSIPTIVDVDLLLTFQAGVDTVTLSGAVQAAVVDFINSLPVNSTLYLSQLYTVLQRFAEDGLVVNQSSIATPVTDITPTTGQTIRTTLANVTVGTPAP